MFDISFSLSITSLGPVRIKESCKHISEQCNWSCRNLLFIGSSQTHYTLHLESINDMLYPLLSLWYVLQIPAYLTLKLKVSSRRSQQKVVDCTWQDRLRSHPRTRRHVLNWKISQFCIAGSVVDNTGALWWVLKLYKNSSFEHAQRGSVTLFAILKLLSILQTHDALLQVSLKRHTLYPKLIKRDSLGTCNLQLL